MSTKVDNRRKWVYVIQFQNIIKAYPFIGSLDMFEGVENKELVQIICFIISSIKVDDLSTKVDDLSTKVDIRHKRIHKKKIIVQNTDLSL